MTQQHVFYRGTDNHIHHIFWDSGSGKFDADDWTLRTRAPLAAGDPVTLGIPGQQHVFFRGVDDHIHHIVWVAWRRRLFRDDWTARSGAPPAEGNPAVLETPGQQHVFFRGRGGSVAHLLWDAASNAVVCDEWTGPGGEPAAGDPTPLATPGQLHVFYRSRGGTVAHIVRDGGSGALGRDDWTSGAPVPPVAGNLAAFSTAGQQHVFYRGTDHSIRHVLWSAPSGTGRLDYDDWTARGRAPAAERDPAAIVTDDGRQHVFYRGAGGAIEHILWDPSSPSQPVFGDWTAGAKAPGAGGGRPAPLVSPGQEHLFYRGQTGGIEHILRDPASGGLWSDDWTSRGVAPRAAGDPATLLTSDSPSDYTWKILPLGDSITEGFNYAGGYRRGLFETANHWGKRLTFVGCLSNGPSDVLGVPFPRSHEGHSGKDIGFITGIAAERLRKFEPDFVLLMIGTNDVLQDNDLPNAGQRLSKLLDEIIAADVCMLTVVARIPPQPHRAAAVDDYNRQVASVVLARAAAGDPVQLADMHTAFPRALLGTDDIHPVQGGYEHMAAVWYAAIDTFLT